jgi:hypothetical protein
MSGTPLPSGAGAEFLADFPDACTLPTAGRPLRRAEFDDLCALTCEVRRDGPGQVRLILSGPDDLVATVRDLAARESECCSFFTFTVGGAGGEAVLDIEVPPAYVDGIVARAPGRAEVG